MSRRERKAVWKPSLVTILEHGYYVRDPTYVSLLCHTYMLGPEAMKSNLENYYLIIQAKH